GAAFTAGLPRFSVLAADLRGAADAGFLARAAAGLSDEGLRGMSVLRRRPPGRDRPQGPAAHGCASCGARIGTPCANLGFLCGRVTREGGDAGSAQGPPGVLVEQLRLGLEPVHHRVALDAPAGDEDLLGAVADLGLRR